MIAICLYVLLSADSATACEKTYSTTARLQTRHPEVFIAISCDFNHITLDSTLAVFHQFADSPTRKYRTLDSLYMIVYIQVNIFPLVGKV